VEAGTEMTALQDGGRWRSLASGAVAAGILFVLTDSVAFASALAASMLVASVDTERVPVAAARGAFGGTLLVLAALGWRGPMAGPLAVALALAGAWCCLDAAHLAHADGGEDGAGVDGGANADDDGTRDGVDAVGGRPTGATGWRALAELGGRAARRVARPLRPSTW
jgi:hypothetical protein